MTRDEILSMAQKAGMTQLMGQTFHGHAMTPDVLVRFAKLAITNHLANSQPAPLVAAPDDSKLAACFDQIKSDLIADSAVEHDLRLEFFPEAVLDAFRRQRAARVEAKQRLADMQELAAKSGLAHRMAVQAAVAEAVAEEREACAALVAEWNTAMTDKLAASIRARGES